MKPLITILIILIGVGCTKVKRQPTQKEQEEMRRLVAYAEENQLLKKRELRTEEKKAVGVYAFPRVQNVGDAIFSLTLQDDGLCITESKHELLDTDGKQQGNKELKGWWKLEGAELHVVQIETSVLEGEFPAVSIYRITPDGGLLETARIDEKGKRIDKPIQGAVELHKLK